MTETCGRCETHRRRGLCLVVWGSGMGSARRFPAEFKSPARRQPRSPSAPSAWMKPALASSSTSTLPEGWQVAPVISSSPMTLSLGDAVHIAGARPPRPSQDLVRVSAYLTRFEFPGAVRCRRSPCLRPGRRPSRPGRGLVRDRLVGLVGCLVDLVTLAARVHMDEIDREDATACAVRNCFQAGLLRRHEEPLRYQGQRESTLQSRRPWQGQECKWVWTTLWMNCANTQDAAAVPGDVSGPPGGPHPPITRAETATA
jgi:hypothetical protein